MNTTAWLLTAAAYGCVGMAFMHAVQLTPRHAVEGGAFDDLRALHGERAVALLIAVAWVPLFAVWPLVLGAGAPWHFWWHRLSQHPTWDCTEPDDTYHREDDPRCNRAPFSWLIPPRSR
ncbi:hypothetical protein [Streptomyces luteireticuli]|uniref:Uncharacterized protein n=1 Tax=Streptomyces luteireticuli TaxID=173858 RepID=A0ABN0Z710_9ACTN